MSKGLAHLVVGDEALFPCVGGHLAHTAVSLARLDVALAGGEGAAVEGDTHHQLVPGGAQAQPQLDRVVLKGEEWGYVLS